MSTIVRRSLSVMIMVITVLGLILTFTFSCSFPYYVTDHSSQTSGYRLFRGYSEGLRVSFEYPDRWRRRYLEKYGTYEVVFLSLASHNSTISVSSDSHVVNGGEFESATALIDRALKRSSGTREFQIVHSGNLSVGNTEWQELVFSYRLLSSPYDPHLPPGKVIDKTIISRQLAVAYRGRIYAISIFMDYDKYEQVRSDFEHLLSTFRFLD